MSDGSGTRLRRDQDDMLEQGRRFVARARGRRAEIWGILLGYNLVPREVEAVAAELKVSPLRISFHRHASRGRRRVAPGESHWKPVPSQANVIDARPNPQFLLHRTRPQRSYPRAVENQDECYPPKTPDASPLSERHCSNPARGSLRTSSASGGT